MQQLQGIAGFEREFFDSLDRFISGETEKNELQLVPEWESTGSDMFVTMLSNGTGFDKHLRRIWSGIFNSMSPGTKMHVMTFNGKEDALLKDLEREFLHLNFQVYSYDGPKFNGVIYSQDMLFASGKKTADGKFKTFTGTIDKAVTKDDASLKMQLRGDDNLVDRYPRTFESQQLPLRLEGGDLQMTRLPDGTSAIILGDNNLRILVSAIISGANANGRGFANGNFDYAYVGAKVLFAMYFGVDQVIVTDEQDVLARMVGSTLQSWLVSREDFYHLDMVVRTAVAPDGKYVAFCTDTDSFSTEICKEDEAYLVRIKKQFADLGYEIESLPCGPFPSMNYTNVLMFTPEGGMPTVMVPFYGLKSDAVAAAIYVQRGFNVKPVDMSYITTLPTNNQRGLGSLHCLVETLA